MNRKSFGKGLRFVGVLMLASPALWSKTPAESVGLTISFYNEAQVPEEVLREGEQEAGRVLRQAGIEVNWLNCKVPGPNEEGSKTCREVVFPEHLHLRIIRKPAGLKGDTLGIAFQTEDGSGCFADLFYEPMEELHKSDGTNLASLLGHVAAHEIGHLLLGTNSHAVAGIMQAHWTAQELASSKAETLVFMQKESRKMKETLLTGRQLLKQAAANAGERMDD